MFFSTKKAPAATYQDQKLFFSGTHFKKTKKLQAIFSTLSHLAFEEGEALLLTGSKH